MNSPDTNVSLAFQNQGADASSAESAINVMEPEENELSTIKKQDDKLEDHGSVIERTFQSIKHGAQVEPAEKEPKGAVVGTGDGPGATAYDVKL